MSDDDETAFMQFMLTPDLRMTGVYMGTDLKDIKPLYPETVIPIRKKVKRTFIDKLLRRQRYQTEWQKKLPHITRAMMKRSINCRCAMVPVVSND